jgi:hypothetical protein
MDYSKEIKESIDNRIPSTGPIMRKLYSDAIDNQENKHRKWYDMGKFNITHDSNFLIEILGHTHSPFYFGIKDNILHISGCSDYDFDLSINENNSTELICKISGFHMYGSIIGSCTDIGSYTDINITDLKTLHIIQHWYEDSIIKYDTVDNKEEKKEIDILWRFKNLGLGLFSDDDEW